MITLLDWLDQEEEIDGGKRKILEYFAELVCVNRGSMNVREFGKVTEGGIYGRTGLTMKEAMSLINLSGIFTGFVLAQGEVMGEAAKIKVQNEINRVSKDEVKITIYTEHDLKSLLK